VHPPGQRTAQSAAGGLREPVVSDLAIQSHPSLDAAAALLASAELPSTDLTRALMEHFFFVGPPTSPEGLVGLELCGPDVLLRSLVVVPQRRSTGLGRTLVAHAEAHARARGARAIYCLTTTAEAFFRRLGYVEADRESAPAAIRATREFADICPESSAFLVKHLPAEAPATPEMPR
jgi:amino-acid N-acetyltransferase